MLLLIAAVLFAIGVGFFAIQNTYGVTLHLGSYLLPGVPVYIIMLASLLGGLLIGWLFSVANAIGTTLSFRRKDAAIQHANTHIATLQDHIHKLEDENSQLREVHAQDRAVIDQAPEEREYGERPHEYNSNEEDVDHRPSFMDNIRNGFQNIMHPRTHTS